MPLDGAEVDPIVKTDYKYKAYPQEQIYWDGRRIET